MGEEHRHGGQGAQPLQLKEVVRPALGLRRGLGRRGPHDATPTVLTWAEVTQTPAVLGVSTESVTDWTATP